MSAEIVVITLGTLQNSDLSTQIIVLSALSAAFTVGVYGLVATIVKMDDLGLYLLRKSLSGEFDAFQRFTGRLLLTAAPMLMKVLSVVGTIAMFLVGGGILTHSLPFLHHIAASFSALLPSLSMPLSIIFDGICGLVAGALLAGMITVIQRFRS